MLKQLEPYTPLAIALRNTWMTSMYQDTAWQEWQQNVNLAITFF